MGNESSAPRNLDKQKARLQNKDRFAQEIDVFRQTRSPRQRLSPVSSTGPPETAGGGGTSGGAGGGGNGGGGGPGSTGINVVCRKRPRFEREFEKEYDAVTCYVDEGVVVAHDGRMRPNMRDITVSHVEFRFDQVFDESDDTKAVYERARVSALVDSVVSSTSNAYLMMFGQTGSGKTFTMRGIHVCVAQELFARIKAVYGEDEAIPEVFLSVFEIGGERCTDLLQTANSAVGGELKLQEKNGEVHVTNLTEHKVRSAAELLGGVDHANQNRATAATGVHDHSSRSHALYGVKLVHPRTGVATTFWLVDLAGSEWSKDSAEHDKLRQVEGAQINKSLLALKECIRIRQKGQKDAHVPYRQSSLTKVLKGCFVDPKARTVVICTVSPCGSDTEHTQCTLSHAAMMDGQKDPKRSSISSPNTLEVPTGSGRRPAAPTTSSGMATPRLASARGGGAGYGGSGYQPSRRSSFPQGSLTAMTDGKENEQQQRHVLPQSAASAANSNNQAPMSAKVSARNALQMKASERRISAGDLDHLRQQQTLDHHRSSGGGGGGTGEPGQVAQGSVRTRTPTESSSTAAATNSPPPFSPAKRQKASGNGGSSNTGTTNGGGSRANEPSFLDQHPSRWTVEEVQTWWDWAWKRQGAPHPNAKTPPGPRNDGKGLVRLSKQRLIQLCDDAGCGAGERMYAMLKSQMQEADALKRKQVLDRKQNIGPGGKEIIPRLI